jgi:hypothetical protein
MDKYIVSYEYKETNGVLSTRKTTTEIVTLHELESLTTLHEDHMVILYCEKL